jgi:hypothetical protein
MDYVLSTVYVIILLLLFLRDKRREKEIKELSERLEIFDTFITKVVYDVINMRCEMEDKMDDQKEKVVE